MSSAGDVVFDHPRFNALQHGEHSGIPKIAGKISYRVDHHALPGGFFLGVLS